MTDCHLKWMPRHQIAFREISSFNGFYKWEHFPYHVPTTSLNDIFRLPLKIDLGGIGTTFCKEVYNSVPGFYPGFLVVLSVILM